MASWLASAPRARGSLLAASLGEAEAMLAEAKAPAPEGQGGDRAVPGGKPPAQSRSPPILMVSAVVFLAGLSLWAVLIVRHLHQRPHPDWVEAAGAASQAKLRAAEEARGAAAGAAIGLGANETRWADDPTWVTDGAAKKRWAEEWRRKNSLYVRGHGRTWNSEISEDEADKSVRRVFVDFRPEEPKNKDWQQPGHGLTALTGTRAGHDVRDILRKRGDGIHGSKSRVPKRVAGQYISWMDQAHQVATGQKQEPTDPTISRVRAIPQLGEAGRASGLPEPRHNVVPHGHKHVDVHVKEAWMSHSAGGGAVARLKDEHVASFVKGSGFGSVSGHAHSRMEGMPTDKGQYLKELIAPHKLKLRGQGPG